MDICVDQTEKGGPVTCASATVVGRVKRRFATSRNGRVASACVGQASGLRSIITRTRNVGVGAILVLRLDVEREKE